MPFVRDLSGGDFDDDFDRDARAESGDVEYVAPEDYRYETVTEPITGAAAIMRELLMALGATELRVNYDGGCDEGFAYPDSIRVNGRLQPIEEVAEGLVTAEVLARLNEVKDQSYIIRMTPPTDRQIVEDAIGGLAEEFAARLLGRGYGTGEQTLYGSFVANLETLEIADDPSAAPPLNGNFF